MYTQEDVNVVTLAFARPAEDSSEAEQSVEVLLIYWTWGGQHWTDCATFGASVASGSVKNLWSKKKN